MHSYLICLTWRGFFFLPFKPLKKKCWIDSDTVLTEKKPNKPIFHVKRKKLLWNALKGYVVSEPEILIFWSCFTYTTSFLLFFFPFLNLRKQSKTNQRNKQTTHFLVKQNKVKCSIWEKEGTGIRGMGQQKHAWGSGRVFFLVTVLGPSIEVQQTGDNYASLANQVQKENESSEQSLYRQCR